MNTRKDVVTMKGRPVTLVGPELKVGQPAPDFEVVANDLKPVRFSTFKGKVCVVSSVPSLDTAVCDMETRKFNQMAAKLGEDVNILTISMDLPFAQKRWCGAAGVDRVITLSDHLHADFGKAYGVLIQELRLLARAVFVIYKTGVIRYLQLVPEISTEPDYDAVLESVKKLV